jgi:hypothetical protein
MSFTKNNSYSKKPSRNGRPKTSNLNIPDFLKKTLKDKNFCAFDEFDGESRILGFGESEFIGLILNESEVKIFMDGTFYTTPRFFAHVYIIHYFKGYKCFPLLYCFLTDKQQNTYVKMLNLVKNFLNRTGVAYNPIEFHVDFEASMINAIRIVHTLAIIRGCYFHFGKAIYRKIQDLGLSNCYRNSTEFKFFVNMVSVLPLVPLNLLEEAIYLCVTLKPVNNDLVERFFSYLMNTWLLENSRFPVDVWTHWNNFGPRTNNNLEGFHIKLNRLLKKAHLNCFHIISHIKEIQMENEMDYKFNLLTGKQRPQIARYRISNVKLTVLKEKILNRSISLYTFMEI